MIRAAIIGMGSWGQHLVDCLGPDSPVIRVVAGATRTPEKACGFAERHGLRMLPSYEAALADPEIDAVVLATPHTQHTGQVVAAAQAGKHVFTEKPLGVSAAEAERAARACAEAGVTLGVGYNWRFQPALQAIKGLIEDGTLGRVLHMEGNFCGPSAYRFPEGHWRHDRNEGPAGGMTGRGVHVVDAMMYLAGPIAQVTAQSFRLVQDFGMDDTTSMLFRFEGGATGYLGTVIATAETWRLQVFGSNAWAEVGDVEHLTTWDLKLCKIDRTNVTKKGRPEILTFPKTSTERAELEHFARAAMARKPLVGPGGDPVRNVAVLEAILESARAGAPVRLS
ncbi:Gfo/Idh/MocA family protein [Muricoccus radiodurans]|uniref:Gfo/Idh/MocA family protein n=1 Tax=Muricoccus radiodurans TaxID=2231721 RepID=UPI003CFA1A42